MERHVKERLIGAAVLMAAAIILIPEMLSGPDRQTTVSSEQSAAGNIKTYTIDLGDSASQSQHPKTIESAPPPDTVGPPPQSSATSPSNTASVKPRAANQTSPELTVAPASGAAVAPQSEPPREPAGDVRQVPTPQPQPLPTGETASRALVSEPSIPTTKGWAVQLGSFSNRESAERLVREFQAERFDAFVMPVKSGSGTLYRVRLGPMQDRAAAEEALRRAKVKVAGAAVVAHP